MRIQKGSIIFKGFLISGVVTEHVFMTGSHIGLPDRLQRKNMNHDRNVMINNSKKKSASILQEKQQLRK